MCQGQNRAWLQGILESHGECVCTSVCAHRGFPLNTGGGGIPGPRRWLLKPNLKEFGKCARGAYLWLWTGEWEMVEWWGEARKEGRINFFVFCGPLQGLVRMASEGWGAKDIRWWGGCKGIQEPPKRIAWLIRRSQKEVMCWQGAKRKCDEKAELVEKKFMLGSESDAMVMVRGKWVWVRDWRAWKRDRGRWREKRESVLPSLQSRALC